MSTKTLLLQGLGLKHDRDLVRDYKQASLNHWEEPGRAERGPMITTKLESSHMTPKIGD